MMYTNRFKFNKYSNQPAKKQFGGVSYDDGEYISVSAINTLKRDILNTTKKHVYPTTFIYFIKNTIGLKNIKINFNRDELNKLRIWSNIMRDKQVVDDDELMYLTYKIGEEIILYIRSEYEEYK